MVSRIIKIFNKQFENINQAAFLLAIFALLSQFLGLIRDRSLAHFIGPGSTLDVYYASFRIPDFLFVSVASIVSVTALLPIILEKISKDGTDFKDAEKFFSNALTFFLIIILSFCVIAFITMPFLSKLIAPGFSEEKLLELTKITRIMLLSPILLGLSNIFGTITQVFKKFFIFSLSQIFYNLGIIIGILFFYPNFGLNGLIFGVILGSLLHFLIQIPALITSNFAFRFSLDLDFKSFKNLFLVSIPRTLAISINNLILIILLAVSSLISEGSVSIFNFSFNLQSFPLTVIGVSYSVAAFPVLASFFSKQDIPNFINHIKTASRQIIFWSLPIMFLFIVLRAQIVRVVLGSGNFSWSDTKITAAMLAVFSISVVVQSLISLFTRAYYAAGQTKKPLLVNLFSGVVIVLLTFGMLYVFRHYSYFQNFTETILRIDNTSGTEILVLPFAYSIGLIINFFLMWYLFKKDFKNFISSDFMQKTFFQSLTASFFLGIVSYFSLKIFANIFDLNSLTGIFLQGLISGILGLITAFIVLKLFKNEELKDFETTIYSKFWKKKILITK